MKNGLALILSLLVFSTNAMAKGSAAFQASARPEKYSIKINMGRGWDPVYILSGTPKESRDAYLGSLKSSPLKGVSIQEFGRKAFSCGNDNQVMMDGTTSILSAAGSDPSDRAKNCETISRELNEAAKIFRFWTKFLGL